MRVIGCSRCILENLWRQGKFVLKYCTDSERARVKIWKYVVSIDFNETHQLIRCIDYSPSRVTSSPLTLINCLHHARNTLCSTLFSIRIITWLYLILGEKLRRSWVDPWNRFHILMLEPKQLSVEGRVWFASFFVPSCGI